MADELIGALRSWVHNPAFRDDAAKSMSLSRDAVDGLVALIEKHATFDVPPREVAEFENTYQLNGDGRRLLAAAQLIRRRIHQEDKRDRLGTVTSLIVLISSLNIALPLDLIGNPVLDSSVSRGADGEHAAGRLSGPVQFLDKLLETWRLTTLDAVPLLGLEQSDMRYVADLLHGRVTLKGRDVEDRIGYLFRIRKTLSALFRSEDVENEWLREPHAALNGQTPLERLLEGSMENLLLVKEYVETAAGR